MDKLLLRQLKKCNMSTGELPSSISDWDSFLIKVSAAYENHNQEIYLLERSLEISSKEMSERWERIKQLLQESVQLNQALSDNNLILNMISQNVPSTEIFKKLLFISCGNLRATGGSAYQYVANREVLEAISSYQLPLDYNNAVNVIPIGEKIGSCGRAAATRLPVYTKNIHSDPNWNEFRHLTKSLALTSCWSTPIINSNGELFGTFALYFSEERLPAPEDINSIESLVQLAILTMQRDRSQSKLQEEQLKVISNSKKAVLGEMAGGIAHEINNPLTIISGYASQLKKLASKDKLTEDVAEKIINKIQTTADRISKIIHSLKIYSRDDEKLPFEYKDIVYIINETLELCSEKFKIHGIELKWTPPKNEIFLVNCNSIQISQVIMNLLVNSYDAVHELPYPWVKIELFEKEESLELSVSDSGPKIPPDIEEKIFAPFFTTKEVGKGTGLGLSISLGIMKTHHGSLALKPKTLENIFVLTFTKFRKVVREI